MKYKINWGAHVWETSDSGRHDNNPVEEARISKKEELDFLHSNANLIYFPKSRVWISMLYMHDYRYFEIPHTLNPAFILWHMQGESKWMPYPRTLYNMIKVPVGDR